MQGQHWLRRVVGALAAILMWLPLAVLMTSTEDSRGQALGVAGLAVSPVVAALLTERAAASRGFGAIVAIQFATISVLVGSLLWGLLFAILDGHDPDDAVGFALVGLVFLG